MASYNNSLEEMLLIQRITKIYNKISTLASLNPCGEVNTLFTELVHLCIPPSAIDVNKLGKELKDMRRNLIQLCGKAESLLEFHYASVLGKFDRPLDHLTLFPYYDNYVKLGFLEYSLLSKHAERPIKKVAFIGSGPMPLTTIVLATKHLRSAQFYNYDIDESANVAAAKLVVQDQELAERVLFRTKDILEVGDELKEFDVVFLAALVGMGRAEKARVTWHIARHISPEALIVVRSAAGARAFLYPVVNTANDLRGFEVLEEYNPADEVINSVIVARRRPQISTSLIEQVIPMPACLMLPCKCSEMPAFDPLNHRCIMEEDGPVS